MNPSGWIAEGFVKAAVPVNPQAMQQRLESGIRFSRELGEIDPVAIAIVGNGCIRERLFLDGRQTLGREDNRHDFVVEYCG